MGSLRPIKNLYKIIRYHGGILRALERVLLTDSAKIGHLVGEDEFGNKYYQNNYYFFGSDRWVIYSRKVGFDYDASQISRSYFNWIHNITDCPPCYDKTRPHYAWILPHTENMTGTKWEYVPYSTVNPKIQAWKPKTKPCPPHPEPVILSKCPPNIVNRKTKDKAVLE